MPLEREDIEGEVRAAYEVARLDPEHSPGVIRLARRTPGIAGIEFARVRGLLSSALVANDDGTRTIFIAPGLPWRVVEFHVAHELGEYKLTVRKYPYLEPDRERVCSALAVGFQVPRPALINRFYTYGAQKLVYLARSFGVSELALALRIGEALDIPVAVVGVGVVRRRGPAVMPGDEELTRMVRRGKLPRGWQLVKIGELSWCWAVIGPY